MNLFHILIYIYINLHYLTDLLKYEYYFKFILI